MEKILSFNWNKYDYVIYDRRALANGNWRGYYRCKFFRSNFCKSRSTVNCCLIDGGIFDQTVIQNKTHFCGEPDVKNIYDFEVPWDIQSEMREFLECRALADHLIASELAKNCLEHFCTKYDGMYIHILLFYVRFFFFL